MNMPSIIIIAVFATGLIVSLLAMIVRVNDPKITQRQRNGVPPTASDIAEAKRKRRKVPLILMVLFFIAILITLAFALLRPSKADTNGDTTNGTVNETSTGADEDQPEAQTPATAENPSEDTGDTPAEAVTEEQVKTDTQNFFDYAMAQASASLKGLGAIGANTVSSNVIAEGNSTEEQSPATEENSTEGTPDATQSYVSRGLESSSNAWKTIVEMTTPADTKYVLDAIVRIDPNQAEREFGQYRLDTKLHTDWEDMDWLMEHMATINYDGQEAIDLLMFPAWSDWLWLEQAAGTREITAEDLKDIDITDHEAVIELIDKVKIPEWQAEWKKLNDAEKAARIDELVYIGICNCPAYAEAWYRAFCAADGVYEASRGVLDDIGRRFDNAYDLSLVVQVRDADGNLTEIYPEDDNYPKGRERWLVYPTDAKVFNPDRPEFSATYNSDYFKNIAAQLCNIYQAMKSGNIKKVKAETHWCLPRLVMSAMRRVAEANYPDTYEAQIKLMPGKNGEMAYKYGVNTSDLRPELLPITVYERKNPPPTNPTLYKLWVEWKYDSISGANVADPYAAWLNAGNAFRLVSKQLDGYTMSIELADGYTLPLDPKILEGNMPSNNVHIIVVYRKVTHQDDNNGDPDPDNPDNPDPDNPENPSFPKDAGEEPVRNGQDGQTGGGGNSGNEDGVEADLGSEEQNRGQNNGQNGGQNNGNNGQSGQNGGQNNGNNGQNGQNDGNSGGDTVHEANTDSKPDASNNATPAAGTEVKTSTDSQGNQTQVEQQVNLSKENSSTNLSSAPE